MRKNAHKITAFKEALSDQKGLTLIDVAIMLIIIGLLVTPSLYALREYKERQARDLTNNNILEIDNAIRAYFVANDFYPCPANPAINRNDPNPNISATHGVSQVVASPAPNAGTCTMLNGSGLAEGSVPHTELGLDIEKVFDGWGNKILYAVDPSMASNTTEATPAPPAASVQITINEIPLVPHPTTIDLVSNPATGCVNVCANSIAGYAAGASPACQPAFVYPALTATFQQTATNVQYTLLSHGEDGRGAFTENGVAIPSTACDGTNGADDENCDNDNVYQTRQCINADTSTAARYDDFMVASAIDKTTNPTAMMSQSDNNADGIAVGVTFVGIRNSDPRRALDVIGNIKVSDIDGIAGDNKDGAARADDYCDITGSDCFDSELIGGSVLITPCPAGQTMVGVRNNGPVCEAVLSQTINSINCANGVNSITGGTPTCAP